MGCVTSLQGESPGGLEKLVENGELCRLEPPALGLGKTVLWELEVGDIGQGLVNPSQPLFQSHGQGTEESERFFRSDHREGVAQELPACGFVRGRAQGGHQGLCLVGEQPVLFCRQAHLRLLLRGEGRERVCQGYTQLALVHPSGRLGPEPGSQGQAAIDPARFLPTQGRDGLRTQTVLVPKRPDHPRLVHGRERAGRVVRAEKRCLLLGPGDKRLHHHRYLALPLLPQPGEPLEPVDDLERAVLALGNPQRQRGERHPTSRLRPPPLAQRLELGPQRRDRHMHHTRQCSHGRSSSSSRPKISSSSTGGPPSERAST